LLGVFILVQCHCLYFYDDHVAHNVEFVGYMCLLLPLVDNLFLNTHATLLVELGNHFCDDAHGDLGFDLGNHTILIFISHACIDHLASYVVHLRTSIITMLHYKHSFSLLMSTCGHFYAHSCPSIVGMIGGLIQGLKGVLGAFRQGCQGVDSRTNPIKRGGDDISSVSPSYILNKDHTSNGQHTHEEVGQGMRGPARSLTSREASHESIRARPPRAPSWLFGLALPCTFRPSPCTPQAAPFKDPCKGI